MILTNFQSAILSGICFGLWPLFMNKSNLSGNVSALVFTSLNLCIIVPFAIYSGLGTLSNANWLMTLVASIFGALGVLFFNGVLARANAADASLVFIIMLCVQASVPAIYNIYLEGNVGITRGIGLLMAFGATILLSK